MYPTSTPHLNSIVTKLPWKGKIDSWRRCSKSHPSDSALFHLEMANPDKPVGSSTCFPGKAWHCSSKCFHSQYWSLQPPEESFQARSKQGKKTTWLWVFATCWCSGELLDDLGTNQVPQWQNPQKMWMYCWLHHGLSATYLWNAHLRQSLPSLGHLWDQNVFPSWTLVASPLLLWNQHVMISHAPSRSKGWSLALLLLKQLLFPRLRWTFSSKPPASVCPWASMRLGHHLNIWQLGSPC